MIPTRPDLILAAHLIDGTGAEPLRDAAVLLRDGCIEAVLSQSDLTPTQRQGREVFDLGSGTLLPGLIDPHVHVTFNAGPTHEDVCRTLEAEDDTALALRGLTNAQRHLAGGVTSIRDVGGRGWVTLAIRDAIRSGAAPGPRMLVSGPAITPPGGHLHYLGAVAANAAEVGKWAAEVLDRGADLVKICATGGIMTAGSDPCACQYTEPELRAAVEVADARGRMVAAHVLAHEALKRCVEAGVRSIEHCMFQTSPGEYAWDTALAERMKAAGTFAGLTFAGLGRARYLEEVAGRPSGVDLGAWRARMEGRYDTERRLVRSGVRWVIHSDSGVRETPFGTFWLSLAAACYELDVAPLAAIQAVTGTAAALLGVEESVGTLAPGKRADLLAVPGNAAERIEALAAPVAVFQDGRLAAERGALVVTRAD